MSKLCVKVQDIKVLTHFSSNYEVFRKSGRNAVLLVGELSVWWGFTL